MNIANIELLPQSIATQLPTHLKFAKALHLIKFFSEQCLQALEAFFIKRNFAEFDAQVGDTACQVRAYHILLLAKDLPNLNISAIYKKLNLIKYIVNKINHDIAYYQELDHTRRNKKESIITLNEFYQGDYYFDLTEPEFFLVQAWILSHYKIMDHLGHVTIDYERLSKDAVLSKNATRRLVHMYQLRVAEASCQFIINLAEHLHHPMLSAEFLTQLKRVDHDGRSVLPCYWTMKTIFAHLHQSESLVLLSIARKYQDKVFDYITLPFVSRRGQFILQTPYYPYHADQPCYIVQGLVKLRHNAIEPKPHFVHRLLKLGIEKAVFLNMAIHPQYVGKTLEYASINPFEDFHDKAALMKIPYRLVEQDFLTMRRNAYSSGCCYTNPSMLYIKHVFCDRFSKQMEFLEVKESYYPRFNFNHISRG